MLSQIGEQDQMGEGAFVAGVDVEEDETASTSQSAFFPSVRAIRIAQIKSDLLARLALRPDAQVRSEARSGVVPAGARTSGGCPRLRLEGLADPDAPDPVKATKDADGDVVARQSRVQVAVSPVDGTFSVNGFAGFDRLIDSGDFGDTYNYSPPEHDVVVDTPDQ